MPILIINNLVTILECVNYVPVAFLAFILTLATKWFLSNGNRKILL